MGASGLTASFFGDALEARVGAIREAFEEVPGFCWPGMPPTVAKMAPLVGPDTATQLAPMRGAVDRGEVDFLSVIEEHDLVLALDRLVHFGHWITPAFVPKRFDTHFFIAATPPGQVAEQDGRETTEAVWTTPQAALEAERVGTATIFFPTRMNLDRLSLVQIDQRCTATLCIHAGSNRASRDDKGCERCAMPSHP